MNTTDITSSKLDRIPSGKKNEYILEVDSDIYLFLLEFAPDILPQETVTIQSGATLSNVRNIISVVKNFIITYDSCGCTTSCGNSQVCNYTISNTGVITIPGSTVDDTFTVTYVINTGELLLPIEFKRLYIEKSYLLYLTDCQESANQADVVFQDSLVETEMKKLKKWIRTKNLSCDNNTILMPIQCFNNLI